MLTRCLAICSASLSSFLISSARCASPNLLSTTVTRPQLIPPTRSVKIVSPNIQPIISHILQLHFLHYETLHIELLKQHLRAGLPHSADEWNPSPYNLPTQAHIPSYHVSTTAKDLALTKQQSEGARQEQRSHLSQSQEGSEAELRWHASGGTLPAEAGALRAILFCWMAGLLAAGTCPAERRSAAGLPGFSCRPKSACTPLP